MKINSDLLSHVKALSPSLLRDIASFEHTLSDETQGLLKKLKEKIKADPNAVDDYDDLVKVISMLNSKDLVNFILDMDKIDPVFLDELFYIINQLSITGKDFADKIIKRAMHLQRLSMLTSVFSDSRVDALRVVMLKSG
jgi:hypothetical protein